MGSGGRQPGHPEISQTGTDGIRKHCCQYRVPQSKRRRVPLKYCKSYIGSHCF